jgi:hypothetical protein
MTITTEWLGSIIATTAVTVTTTIVVGNLLKRRNGNGNGTAKLAEVAAKQAAERVAELAEDSARAVEGKLDAQSLTLNRLCENLKPLESLPDSQTRMIELLARIEGLLQRR